MLFPTGQFFKSKFVAYNTVPIIFWRLIIAVGAVHDDGVEVKVIWILIDGFDVEYEFISAFVLYKFNDKYELRVVPISNPNTLYYKGIKFFTYVSFK